MAPSAGPADPTIDILLATYNGAAYLDEQLASIEAQTHRTWRLIARDDGSSDRTPEILAAFQARHPKKVTIIRDRDGNLGLVQNFSRLMEASTAPYAAFCDQDDVWLPEKLSICLEKMCELEAEHGTDKPLLVFTDLTVVDENLRQIAPSFWRHGRLRPEHCRVLSRLLLENVVTGCTVLMNRALVQKSLPIPSEAKVHDWWIALVAAAFGRSGFLGTPTVLYRQHAQNLVGARRLTLRASIERVAGSYQKERTAAAARFRQADAFCRQVDAQGTQRQKRVCEKFAEIPSHNLLMRTIILFSGGYFTKKLAKNIGFVFMSSRKNLYSM